MARPLELLASVPLLLALVMTGCQTANHTEEGALFGGLFGAGTGAMVGHACGNTLAGAAIGTAAGTMLGAAAGNEEDKIDAQNRAFIAQQMGRQLRAGAVTIEDVVAMTRANVNEELIITQVRTHSIARPLEPHDLIYLQQQGISPRIIAAMQASPPPQPQAVIVEERAPPPVIVEGYWGPSYYHPHHPHRYYW